MSRPAPARKRILIADDDALFKRGLIRLFATERFDVADVGDGESAIKSAAASRFDLIIVDYRMPRVNGLELIEKLNEVLPEVPVILVSAYGSSEMKETARLLGARAVVEKPISPEDFLALCRVLLQQSDISSSKESGKETSALQRNEEEPR